MKRIYSLGLVIALYGVMHSAAFAATNFWQDISASFQEKTENNAALNVLVKQGRRLTASLDDMRLSLSASGDVVVSLPLPDGEMASYQFSYDPIMPIALAVKYPQILTFKAFDINNPDNHGSFDITPQGFHGMFKHDGKWVFIDPENRNDVGRYVAYYKADAQPLSDIESDEVIDFGSLKRKLLADKFFSSRPIVGTNLRTYRLAMAATGEYTEYHGSRLEALAAINTLVGRLNQVYERDMSIRFELIADNDQIIYTNPSTDPYNNNSNDAETNGVSLAEVIDEADFDLGHVLATRGGGLAFLSGVCTNTFKSIGMTGLEAPTGDVFYMDYVAHEIGHQLGANHTFNGTSLACGSGNRSEDSAWEPGSGSTIMGYAGICGSQNLQTNSDHYFHTGSIQEILETAESAGCGVVTPTANTIPIADAGEDMTVPAGVPFKLTGSGTDADGDTLTYTWEQFDLGEASFSLSTMVDDGTRPLFRSLEPSSSPERYFPDLQDFESDNLMIGETMPTTNRDLTFRLTVRDGKGGVATDEVTVTVSGTASSSDSGGGGAFSINYLVMFMCLILLVFCQSLKPVRGTLQR